MRMLTLATVIPLAFAASATAQDVRVGDIVIDHAWADPAVAGQPMAAGYLTIRNEGETADRIVAARTDVAERVEFHAMRMADGGMRMTPLETVEAPPGGEVVFAPGGAHLMLFGLTRGLAVGESFTMT
ncbi:MAG: copper chaperone PCu(A)C, partial [Gammaproteobacteria bacterium]|nr:copper chaperone PCu(A)C [Gammaproteobacteria bacterium]